MNGCVPEVGQLAVDSTTGRIGVLVARTARTAWLRPQAGGLEWTVPVGAIRQATASETLRPRVTMANDRSRRRL